MRSGIFIKEYNEKHKDQQIELTAAESFKVADAIWVLEGRYDAFFDIKLPLKKLSQIKMVLTNMRTNELVCLQRNSNLPIDP